MSVQIWWKAQEFGSIFTAFHIPITKGKVSIINFSQLKVDYFKTSNLKAYMYKENEWGTSRVPHPKSGVLDKMNLSLQTFDSFYWLKTRCLNLDNFQDYKSDRIKVA